MWKYQGLYKMTGQLNFGSIRPTLGWGQVGIWGKGLVDGEVGGVANDFGTSVDSQGRFTFGVGNPDTHLHGSVINDGNWHHCAATRIASTGEMKVYTDGVLDNSVIGPTGTKTHPPSLRIGMLQTGIHPLNGLITEVRIWNVARTAQPDCRLERPHLWQVTNPVLPATGAHKRLWKLTPETNTLPDLSGHGNDGQHLWRPTLHANRNSNSTNSQLQP